MKKERLIILSDIFGGKKPEWIEKYTQRLKNIFDIQYYDVRKLGEIDESNASELTIYDQFINGGIDKAVANLLVHETSEVAVLGFSIGGTIAWKAILKGLKVSVLICVSSTRLRYETEVPMCKIKLFYGELDLNKPNSKWFLDLKITNHIFKNQDHQFYLINENILLICDAVL